MKEQVAANNNMQNFANNFSKNLAGKSDIAFAIAVIGILMVLLFPVPTWLIDFLLGISFSLSVLILMTCLFITKPLELSVFPTILLVATILRLSLNIASTRLILSQGHMGTWAAGHVIEAFGNFVMSGNLVIGAIVFLILTIINFIVITKGSGRIAEVAARFSLDAMPGKQMAIDADLSAGLIDEQTAKSRRKELEDESTFFGAMDGANKFVRGDAIAGLLITFVNFIAGIIIGVVQRDLTIGDALHTYSILTIGDGLVSQIPGLVISIAAGLLVSKSGVNGSTDKAIIEQLGKYPQALMMCSGLTALMAIMPGIPFIPFFIISAAAGGTSYMLSIEDKKGEKEKVKKQSSEQAVTQKKAQEKSQEEQISEALQIDSILLSLGYGLLPLVNAAKGNKLTDQIKALRKEMAKELGFIIPAIRIQDNLQLNSNEYQLKIKDIECGSGSVKPDMIMVMDPKGGKIDFPGEPTTEPAFGLPAMWVQDSFKEEALFKNYTVVDPSTVVTTHLTEIIKDNITDLLSYSETQKLIEEVKQHHKKLIEDTVPSVVSITTMQRILQNLLAENVSIRDMPTILEAVAEFGPTVKNAMQLTEFIRVRLARQISFANTNRDGYIAVVTLSPEWEKEFFDNIVGNAEDRQLNMPPSKLHEFIGRVKQVLEEQAMKGELPCLMVAPILRPYIRSVVERFRSSTVVLSQSEIHPKFKIKTLWQI